MSSSTAQFGQNQWLVEEMYQRFKEDPSSVDASWHEFLADYTPDASSDAANGAQAQTEQPSATKSDERRRTGLDRHPHQGRGSGAEEGRRAQGSGAQGQCI